MSTQPELLANENIEAESVRLVHKEIGFNQVMSIKDALLIATNENLDLVQMSDQEVPVVKLMDLNKYKFEQQQKARAQRKNQRETTIKTKEIQLSLDIQQNDMLVKLKKANKFLSKGNHLKVSLRLHGRARSNASMQDLAIEKVQEFVGMLDAHEVTAAPKKADTIVCLVKPNA
ncbi:translation initiation factor IF-3 [Vibrio phage 2.275.O._10N.286.54.E11]|nr:translation initiation factor IF-3 [Vibrio phage 2.275.O._10N.286.54.E11]